MSSADIVEFPEIGMDYMVKVKVGGPLDDRFDIAKLVDIKYDDQAEHRPKTFVFELFDGSKIDLTDFYGRVRTIDPNWLSRQIAAAIAKEIRAGQRSSFLKEFSSVARD